METAEFLLLSHTSSLTLSISGILKEVLYSIYIIYLSIHIRYTSIFLFALYIYLSIYLRTFIFLHSTFLFLHFLTFLSLSIFFLPYLCMCPHSPTFVYFCIEALLLNKAWNKYPVISSNTVPWPSPSCKISKTDKVRANLIPPFDLLIALNCEIRGNF